MAVLRAVLVTPERAVFEAEVEAVFARSVEGEAAFMAGHTPLVGALVPGLVRFRRPDGTEERAAVHGGFVDVTGDRVTVLAPIAELAGELDLERARAAEVDATEALAALRGAGRGPETAEGHPDREFLAAEARLRRAEVRLEVAGETAAH